MQYHQPVKQGEQLISASANTSEVIFQQELEQLSDRYWNNADKSASHPDRNHHMLRLAEFCVEHVATDHRGLINRQSILDSRKRKLIAKEYGRVQQERYALLPPR